ncbi:16S rRNA (uracil(1498)-N(3))-methyltransferase [Marinivivus vitaminiproducens]|uniref:16S rRNA (uracil(1498)-N(3))-methyltransferase n=1 Tax=Marinivivus vitaminiproducens TaxID=3035935 RepID=UPI0027A2D629|nr:16S rRNA (uracil(1498)-N(3))-methyltransferase [Geminicoccaceae bacterium SCSIO 64248]
MIRLHRREPLAEGLSLELDAKAAHYLVSVMRRPVGAEVAVFNAGHGEWRARVDHVGRRSAILTVAENLRPPPGASNGPELWFAPIKKARMETVIEKAVELGVRRLQPVVTRRSVVDRLNPERLDSIMVEAAEQSGRLDLPELMPLRPLPDLLAEADPARPVYAGTVGHAAPSLARALRERGSGPVLIGPEGGFASEELADLRSRPYVVFVGLGPRTLRAETAAIAALACWQATLGDWEP